MEIIPQNLDIQICFTKIGPKVMANFVGKLFLDRIENGLKQSNERRHIHLYLFYSNRGATLHKSRMIS